MKHKLLAIASSLIFVPLMLLMMVILFYPSGGPATVDLFAVANRGR
jgi:hypothetical protein